MFTKRGFAGVLLAAAVLVPSASFAAPEKAPCILSTHRITSVKPYKIQKPAGRGVTSRLAGAELFVRAEPGLTPEWLELQLACAAGGLLAGIAVAVIARQRRVGLVFVAPASGLALLTGAMGCSCVGLAGLAGLGAGYAVGLLPAVLRGIRERRA